MIFNTKTSFILFRIILSGTMSVNLQNSLYYLTIKQKLLMRINLNTL